MSRIIESTSDTPEQVLAATGGMKQETATTEVKESGPVDAPVIQASKDEESVAGEETQDVEAKAETKSESETDENEDAEDDAAKDETKPKRKGGFKRRIDRLTVELSKKEQEAEYWREQALKAAGKKGESTNDSSQVAVDGKPNEDDFENYADYIEALTDWKAEQVVEKKLAKKDEVSKEEAFKIEQQQKAKAVQDACREYAKQNPDFDELMEGLDDIPMSAAVRAAILESENAPALMHEFGKDPEQYEKICQMGAIAAARAIGRIEAKLETSASSKQDKPAPKTKAPKPITPVTAQSKSATTKDPEKMTYQEWKRYREQQLNL